MASATMNGRMTVSKVREIAEEIAREEIANATFNLEAEELDSIAVKVREMATGATFPSQTSLPSVLALDPEMVRDIGKVEVANMAAKLKAKAEPKVFVVQWPDDTKTRVKGTAHPSLSKVLMLAVARKNILLVGPAGSGKTFLAKQVSESLKLPFAHISCSAGMSEGQLLGRLLPVGKGGSFEYVISEFVRCYEEGGVFLFDEIDAADSNTLLVINSALANGYMALPNRSANPVAKRHPDFVCIAAANTWGTGADRQYVGRNQLDESTLDRFRIGQIAMDYDDGMPATSPEAWTAPAIPQDFIDARIGADGIEVQKCPDTELRIRLQWYRQQARLARVQRVISTRFLEDAWQMKQVGFTDADIDGALTSGWSKDEIRKVKGG